MFVKRRTRRIHGQEYHSFALVETVRTDRGPRHRTICGLGDLPDGVDLRTLGKQLDAVASGQQTILGDLDANLIAQVREAVADWEDGAIQVDTSRVSAEEIRELGPVLVGHELWRRLGLPGILGEAGLSEPAQGLVEAMALNRLVNPSSEHAMPAWFARTAIGDLLGKAVATASDDRLYRMLDRLYQQREPIERALAQRERTLFELNDSILLYDLTSTYFEGLAEGNPKAQRGYSRDGRPDCKQVVIGLVLDGEGFPRAHEVFAGNTADSSSVERMLDALERRIGRRPGATVVVDRGMSGAQNLELIQSRGYHYIVACRQSERDGVYNALTTESGWTDVLRTPSPTNPAQRKTAVRVTRIQRMGWAYLGVHSAERVDKDRAIRERHESRFLADIERLKNRIATGKLRDHDAIHERIGSIRQRYTRVARYYDVGLDEQGQLSVTNNKELRDHAVALDGTYLMKTDRLDMPDDEIWRTYMLLTRVEHAFRDLKTPLGERPIFHQVEHRVEAHIFLCVLAYHLLVAIEYMLRQQKDHRSWATIRDQLRSHQFLTIVLPTTAGTTLRIRRASTPEADHRDIYALLHIDPDTLPITRSWHEM
jgi:transposase